MSDFLFLFRGGQPSPDLSPAEMEKHMNKWRDWIGGLAKAGKFKAGNPLESEGKVIAGKKKLVTDGPFVEGKEVVGGYLIVTAKDLMAAAELAKGCPIFEDGGSTEVRGTIEME